MPNFGLTSEPHIFIVSNRLPVSVSLSDDGIYDFKVSSGGLVGALQGLSQSTAFKWYGWPGLDIPHDDRGLVREELAKRQAVPVFFGKTLAERHYNGFCNKILWPLLHYQTNEIYISQPDWKAYQEVNRLFAESLVAELCDNDIVWVQDYHLFLLPSALRTALNATAKKNIKIGFFLHTVFPASDFFRILPVREEILTGLLNCDVVGFHNHDYTDHFINSCRKILGLEVSDSTVSYQGRTVRIVTQPIGIDAATFHVLLGQPDVQGRIHYLLKKYADVKLMISVDRLDYIKGIPLRIDAMDTLLTQHPELIGKVVLLQIVIPSREDVHGYQQLHLKINERVSTINGKFGQVEFSPIQSLFNSVTKEELTALYATADACVVSSTRDGLNIVCSEYIACQQERHGVLLLSEFAGAAEVLQDAIKFNPWDTFQFADAIHEALTMDEDEKARRSERLHTYVTENTSQRWGELFLHALTETNGDANETGE